MESLPHSLTYPASFITGLIIGSFLNVVIVRLPYSLSLISPGSHCPSCKDPVRWWDNLPVISFLWLRGKCRSCKAPISIRYPVIELLTAVLFLAVTVRFGWSLATFFRDWPFVALMICVTFIDLEHRIIPDPLSLGGLVLGLATFWLIPGMTFSESFFGAAFGFSIFYGLAWIYQRWKGVSGLGGGDIKLLAMIGAFLGPGGVVATIVISSIFGSIVGISWGLLHKKKDLMKIAIPYGPFLVVGALYYYLLGDILWLQFMIPT